MTLEMSKDYMAMGTNYKRRLGGTDKFLTTTIRGKRIEGKSDLLTEIYNNKIMKNLKTMIDDFQLEAKKRIANGEFEVVKTIQTESNGYIGYMKINIDEVSFEFSISKHGYVSEHGPYKIFNNSISDSEYKSLKGAY